MSMSKKRTMCLSFSKTELNRSIKMEMGAAGVMIEPSLLASKGLEGLRQESFGWWGTSADSNKFYPGLNVGADVVPKPEDYIRAAFRLISATIVAGGTWRATDFSRPGVLKASVKMLDRKPIYKDHDTDLNNWCGMTEQPVWSEAFTAPDGTSIPAGINATMAIDAKVEPKIARGILSGVIFSNSVTVEFEWEPSHTFENDYEFDSNVGKLIDGKMVCRVATKIVDYYESSLVWLGADPYAKLIDADGNFVNIDESSTFDDAIVQTEYQKYTKTHSFSIKAGLSKEVLSLTRKSREEQTIPTNTKTDNKMTLEELLIELRKTLKLAADAEVTPDMLATLTVAGEEAPAAEEGLSAEVVAEVVAELTGEEVTAETVSAKLTGIKGQGFKLIKADTENADVAQLTTQVKELTLSQTTSLTKIETLESELETAKGTIIELKPQATMGEKFISAKRAEAIRLHDLSTNNKPSKAITEFINTASVEQLDGLLEDYTKGETARFSGRCKDCGSTEFEFRSSVGDDENAEDTGAEAKVPGVSFQDIHSKLAQEQRDAKVQSRLNGKN